MNNAGRFLLQLGLIVLATCSLSVVAHGQTKPPFQYELGDTRISIPSADEPRVKEFGPQSIKAAAQYLEMVQ